MLRRLRMTLLGASFVLAGALPLTLRAAEVRPAPIKPENTRPSEVRIWNSTFTSRTNFYAFEETMKGGGFLAAGDLDGNGVAEIVVGTGPGRESEVRVFAQDGKRLSSFTPYPVGFRGGVRVAVADVDGDGKAEIITAPGPGHESRIFIFEMSGKHKLAGGGLAYAPKVQGGVHIAAADVDGDGKAEIITAPGPGGGPHIRMWNGKMENLGRDFFAYDSTMTDGVRIAMVRSPQGINLVTVPESWTDTVVKRFRLFPGLELTAEFRAFNANDRAGGSLSAFDLDRDGFDEIAVMGNGGRAPELRLFDVYGTYIAKYLVHDPTYRGGTTMAQVDGRLAIVSVAPVVLGPWDKEKFIDVNITEQRLYAYERGRLAKTFLVSTGTKRHPTPLAKTTVRKKIPIMDYRWSYGVNHPDNYNIKNVKFNLNINDHIYIHTAYWHNNFGNRMSHGCVNTKQSDAEWIYNWAEVGVPVETHT